MVVFEHVRLKAFRVAQLIFRPCKAVMHTCVSLKVHRLCILRK